MEKEMWTTGYEYSWEKEAHQESLMETKRSVAYRPVLLGAARQ